MPSENAHSPVAVSRDSGDAATPSCWAVIWRQGEQFRGIEQTCFTEGEAQAWAKALNDAGDGLQYSHEPIYLGSSLARLREEHAALLKVAGRALRETRVEEIGDWDGGDLQDAMTESGLLEIQNPEVPCRESCRCADFYEAGENAVCYVFTDLAQRALKSLETSDPRSA